MRLGLVLAGPLGCLAAQQLKAQETINFSIDFPNANDYYFNVGHFRQPFFSYVVAGVVFQPLESGGCVVYRNSNPDERHEVEKATVKNVCLNSSLSRQGRITYDSQRLDIWFSTLWFDQIWGFGFHDSIFNIGSNDGYFSVSVLTDGAHLPRNETSIGRLGFDVQPDILVAKIYFWTVLVYLLLGGLLAAILVPLDKYKKSKVRGNPPPTPPVAPKKPPPGLLHPQLLFPEKRVGELAPDEALFLVDEPTTSSAPPSSKTDGRICCICVAKLHDEDLVRVLHCQHVFHVRCIDEWFRKHSCCPLCKRDYKADQDPLLKTEQV